MRVTTRVMCQGRNIVGINDVPLAPSAGVVYYFNGWMVYRVLITPVPQ